MNEAHALGRRLLALAADALPTEQDMQAVGDALIPFAERAISSTLSDRSMSGWHAKGRPPFALTGHASVSKDGSSVEIVPAAEGGVNWRKGAGPMRVLTDGRAAYKTGDRRRTGTRVNKVGERVAKTRKIKGTVGATRGKGTWDDVNRTLIDESAGVVQQVAAQNMATHIARTVLGG